MALERFIFILFLLLSQVAHAQTILMFEDQTKTGFKLVMNNYLQNETALPKLNLQKFPDAENEVYLILENGIHIKRKLPKLPKGNHKYVIYKDFKGKHQLRYRGISTELSQSALMFDYKEKLIFNKPALAAIKQADTLSHFPDWKKNQLALARKDSLQKDSLRLALVEQKQAEALQRKKDSLNKISLATEIASAETKDSAKVVLATVQEEAAKATEISTTIDSSALHTTEVETPKVGGFATFILSFESSDFEFDKLSMAKEFASNEKLKAEEAQQVLKGLKYDQSRLDFLHFLLTKQDDLKDSQALLIGCLDFDLSKEQAKSLFKK
ncbi:DUF4476 domain-containing protein [Croceimicrobium sp.]|uniref:DUF4476 domain-containing protein n=1 Tax=Croceimicrobium sp. TaxID=2828340 RepID=UPI003BA8FF56